VSFDLDHPRAPPRQLAATSHKPLFHFGTAWIAALCCLASSACFSFVLDLFLLLLLLHLPVYSFPRSQTFNHVRFLLKLLDRPVCTCNYICGFPSTLTLMLHTRDVSVKFFQHLLAQRFLVKWLFSDADALLRYGTSPTLLMSPSDSCSGSSLPSHDLGFERVVHFR
jgi:hypothetical protein